MDTEGNPHVILGLFPTDGSYVFLGIIEENGYYHFTIDKENDDVIWVASSLVEDEQIDVFVAKSTDGGHTWENPYNATNTNISLDCPNGLTINSLDEICVHTGNGAKDTELHIVYQMPNYCYGSTTGDISPVD